MLKKTSPRTSSALAYRRTFLALALLSLLVIQLLQLVPRFSETAHAAGSVSLSALGVTVTENFNTLINGANDTLSSAGVPPGWDFSESGTNANTTYRTGTGSGATGDTYSFGTPTTSTERAFGQLRSGTAISILGASFTNNTGSAINALGISYTGEQWRIGATSHSPIAEHMDFQYSTNATSLTTGTYVDVNALDFDPPVTTAGATGALDGNAAANRRFLGSTITGLSIPNGATFWIRWTDVDASGADDGLAVDDFSITPLAGSIGANGVRTTDVQGTDDGGFAMALQADSKIVVGGYAVDSVNGDKEFAVVRYNYNGTLDTTFGGTGKVVTDFTGTSDRIWGITIQSDNKIVAVGETFSSVTSTNDVAMTRYNADGSLDLTFGVAGKVTTDYLVGNNSAYGVAMSGTNIYVVGAATVAGNYDFMVARYTTLGVLDPTFNPTGTPPGIATTGFGSGNDIARAVAIDGSSRPVVGGYSNNGGDDFAIARFTTAGALDTTFVSPLGKAAIDLGNSNADQAFGIAIDSAQRIILAGSTYNGTNKDFALVRYLSTGALDATFGSGGIVTTDFANSPDVALSVYVRSDNFIVAGGFSRYSSSSDDFALARYNASGVLDTTFDTDGKLTMRISNADERIYGVAQEFDTKIVAAGFAAIENSNPVTRNFALARFNPDGSLDAATPTELTRPDLIVSKSGPGQNVIAGNNFTYNITVTNLGPGSATNVVLTDTLPAGLAYVGHSASNGTSGQSAGTVTNNVGTLAPNTTATLSITVSPGTTVGLVSNTASVTLTESDLNITNNSATDYTRIIGVIDMSFSPSTVVGGCQNSQGTVTLSGLAPTGGATVTLSTVDPAAANPGPSVTVPAGFNSANFTVFTGPVPSNRNVRMEATLGPTSFVRRLVVNTGNCN
ncbi:MAG TPA: hypothetical protein VGC87_12110 [Pyrinomonadaceae bacterium]|jgi:uncharacterized delta-60 repeat protein/uncharacterized repeat protein (TIGR01451 family)